MVGVRVCGCWKREGVGGTPLYKNKTQFPMRRTLNSLARVKNVAAVVRAVQRLMAF